MVCTLPIQPTHPIHPTMATSASLGYGGRLMPPLATSSHMGMWSHRMLCHILFEIWKESEAQPGASVTDGIKPESDGTVPGGENLGGGVGSVS